MWSKSGKKRTSIWGNTLPCLTWETWRTIHYELTGIVCVIWLGTVLLVWHIDQVFPFTLTPLQAAAAQVPKKDKDDFSVFWLAANDPPDLCWDKVASSFFDCKYNLQLIGKCVIICITRNIFTMKSFYCFICDITSQACISASSFLTWPHTEKDSFCHYRCQLSPLFPIHAYITPD